MAGLDLFDIASRLATCIGDSLRNAEHPDDRYGVNRNWKGTACVWSGSQVAYDTCCEEAGQAWVVVNSGFITDSYPRPDSGSTTPCKVGSVAQTFEVGVLRCVGDGSCDCECKEQNALDVMIDFQALLAGVLCCFYDEEEDNCGSVQGIRWRFIGPEGGCAGSAITFTVQADTPCCPS